MAKRKTIGIDLDDVLLDFNQALCEYHNARYDPKYTWDNIRTYALENTWVCTREEVRRRIFEFYVTDEHARALPVTGAQEALKRISRAHNCVVVTSRPETIRERTLEWCEKHFPGLFRDIHFTNQFGTNIPTAHKGEVCQRLGIEVYIEEAPHHALDVAQSGIPVLLYNVPWNQGVSPHPNVTRVYSWEDIAARLR